MKLKLLLLSLVFLLSQVTAAFAGPDLQASTIRLIVSNKTGDTVDIRLAGPTNTTEELETGKNTLHLLPGRYSYTYKACGTNQSGTFQLTTDRQKFDLVKCTVGGGGSQDTTPIVSIRNKTDQTITVTLTGPRTYTVKVDPKSNEKVTVEKGKYKYSYSACGIVRTGSVNPGERGPNNGWTTTASIEIEKCASSGGAGGAAGAGAGGGGNSTKTIVLVIHNKTDATLTFTFVGPQTYRVQAFVGKTRVTMEKGRYSWTMYSNACGGYGTDSGTLNLNQSASWTWTCD